MERSHSGLVESQSGMAASQPEPQSVSYLILCRASSGKLAPAAAFMTGKMKLSGDMGKAMKLEKMMGKLKSKL